MSQGGNTLGMEETHSSISVLTVDEHAAERWRTTRDLGGSASGVPGLEAGDEAEAAAMLMLTPCIKTSETTPSPSEADFTSILLPVDSKERRVLLRRAGVDERASQLGEPPSDRCSAMSPAAWRDGLG